MKTRYTVSDGKLVLNLEAQDDGGYVVTSPLDPELITQADTIEEAFANARDAAQALKQARLKLLRRLSVSTMANYKKPTFWLFSLILIVCLTGCGATETVDRDTVRYTPKAGTVAFMLSAGLGVTALGAFMVVRDLNSGGRGSRRSKKSADAVRNSLWSAKSWGVLIGGLLLLAGGGPGVMFSQVTVTRDQVSINDSPFWFAPNRATVWFADVQDISNDSEERWTRRGKRTDEYLVFHKTDGSFISVKVGPLVRAATDRIMANLQASRGGRAHEQPPIAITGGAFDPGASAGPVASAGGKRQSGPPAPASRNTASLEPAPQAALPNSTPLAPGMKLEAFWGNQWLPVEVIEVQPDGQVKVHWDGYSAAFDEVLPRTRLRLGTQTVTSPTQPKAAAPDASALKPGMKLEANWGNQWLPVEVLAVQPDGQVKVHWEGYSANFDEVLSRSRLRMPTK